MSSHGAHLSDSLSNPSAPLLRLVTALDEVDGSKKAQVNSNAREAIVAQSGAVDPGLVRLEMKENRILIPGEVAELVEEYRRGAGVRELARQYGVHRHTVDRHLERAGVVKRPVVKMTPSVVARARELQEQGWGAQRIGRELGMGASTVCKALKRVGVDTAAGGIETR